MIFNKFNELNCFKFIVGTIVFAILLLGANASAVEQIEAYNGSWQVVSEEEFPGQVYPDYRYATRTIELPVDTTIVRLTQSGTDTAHLDMVLLDGEAPTSIIDKSTNATVAPAKLAQADYDVINAEARAIEMSWTKSGSSLVLAAVEEDLFGGPLLWPQQGYLEYTLDENKPETFSQYFIPASSHPASSFYATFSTTSEELIVYLDATGDNTFDPSEDWAELRIITPDGAKKFRINSTMTIWGTSTFEYTDKVTWEHKTCQFNIPLEEIGLSQGNEIQLQIRYYGTESEYYYMQLEPVSATNPVGTPHTVTATVFAGQSPFTNPAQGIDVAFNVASGPHAGLTHTNTTNSSGQATFTYTGTTDGTDVIEARIDPILYNQPYPTVTKVWNQPPVADANGPYVGVVGSPITLDASGSYDLGGFIVSWEWDIDGDGEFDDATGETVMWTWNNVHTGVVAVRVTDDAGDTDFDATTVTINEGGGVEIPEFPTIALPIIAVLGLAFFFQRRKD